MDIVFDDITTNKGRILGIANENVPSISFRHSYSADHWITDDQIEEHLQYYLVAIPEFGAIKETIKFDIYDGIVSLTGIRKPRLFSDGHDLEHFRYDFSLPRLGDPKTIKIALHNEKIYISIEKRFLK